jgi:hypothetical protein
MTVAYNYRTNVSAFPGNTGNIALQGLEGTNLAFVHQKLQLLELLVQHVPTTLDVLLPLFLQLRLAFRVVFLALCSHALLLLVHRI